MSHLMPRKWFDVKLGSNSYLETGYRKQPVAKTATLTVMRLPLSMRGEASIWDRNYLDSSNYRTNSMYSFTLKGITSYCVRIICSCVWEGGKQRQVISSRAPLYATPYTEPELTNWSCGLVIVGDGRRYTAIDKQLQRLAMLSKLSPLNCM